MERAVGLTSQVCELAVQAGKRIMDIYHNGAAVTWKKDASPLTAADQASHEFLVNSLQLCRGGRVGRSH
jgi:3'(2'), 5'-bisphosphate nucleotidase